MHNKYCRLLNGFFLCEYKSILAYYGYVCVKISTKSVKEANISHDSARFNLPVAQ